MGRVKRKTAGAQADLDGKLLKKSSLNIALVPESEADRTTAALLRMAPAVTPEQRQRNERGEIMDKQTIFDATSSSGVVGKVSTPTVSKAAAVKQERVKQFQKLVSVRKRQSADASGFASFSASIKVGRKDPPPSTSVSSQATSDEKEIVLKDADVGRKLSVESEAVPAHEGETGDTTKDSKPSTNALSSLLCNYDSSGSDASG